MSQSNKTGFLVITEQSIVDFTKENMLNNQIHT